jgi:hypothetical protein
MTSGRTGPWTKTRQPIVLFSGSGLSTHMRSLADFITIMSVFEFSVRTAADKTRRALAPDNYLAVFFLICSILSFANVANAQFGKRSM